MLLVRGVRERTLRSRELSSGRLALSRRRVIQQRRRHADGKAESARLAASRNESMADFDGQRGGAIDAVGGRWGQEWQGRRGRGRGRRPRNPSRRALRLLTQLVCQGGFVVCARDFCRLRGSAAQLGGSAWQLDSAARRGGSAWRLGVAAWLRTAAQLGSTAAQLSSVAPQCGGCGAGAARLGGGAGVVCIFLAAFSYFPGF